MIIISNKQMHNLIYIYRNLHKIMVNEYIFKLINRTTNWTKEYTVEELNKMPEYYTFAFYDGDIKDGEYEYELIEIVDDERQIISKGLINIGDYSSYKNSNVYNQKIEYNIYNK